MCKNNCLNFIKFTTIINLQPYNVLNLLHIIRDVLHELNLSSCHFLIFNMVTPASAGDSHI